MILFLSLYKWPNYSFPCFLFFTISIIYSSLKLCDKAVKQLPGSPSIAFFSLGDLFSLAFHPPSVPSWQFSGRCPGMMLSLFLELEHLLDPLLFSCLVCSFILLEHFFQELLNTSELNLLLLYIPANVFIPLSYVYNLVKFQFGNFFQNCKDPITMQFSSVALEKSDFTHMSDFHI